MDPNPDQQAFSWDSVIRTVEKDLMREFGASRTPEAIEAVAKLSVAEFMENDVRITTFVPVLAERAARQMLREAS